MTRRTVAALGALVLVATGCSSEVVNGRAVAAPRNGQQGSQTAARFTDPTTIADVSNDVRDGVEAVNTYDYRSIEAARINALRYTTGKLSSDLTTTFRNVIAKNAPALHASQQARVNNIGVASLSGATASLLVFGQLLIRTDNLPEPRKDPFVVTVDAKRVSGRWKLSAVSADGSLAGTAPGTAGLRAAVQAVRTATAGLSSFRRASFDADYARVLSLLTGAARSQVQGVRDTTLNALRNGKFDLVADVKASAVEQASGNRAVVLISLNGYRVKNGKRGAATVQQLRVTASKVGSRWLVATIDSIGVR